MVRPSTPETAALRQEIGRLRARLEETEATLQAIRHGEIDAVLVEGPAGPRMY